MTSDKKPPRKARATAKPRTHIYVFFMPWALLAATVLVRGFFALQRRIGERSSLWLGSAAAVLPRP